MSVHILLVEDDSAIAKSLQSGLEFENYVCSHFSDAESVLSTLDRASYNIALLDIRLPGMNGLELCKQIRSSGHTFPIIVLSARDEEIDKVLGLEMGADDYMVKPYSFRELLSRIRAQLRRAGEYSIQADDAGALFGHIRIDYESMRVYKHGALVDITPTEFRMLRMFIEYEGQSLSREQIIAQVWGEHFYLEDLRTVDVHVRHLREKLEDRPNEPMFLQTVRGFGYRFVKKP